jgi:hypothetical protein
MSTKGPNKPSDPHAGLDWDEDAPTDVKRCVAPDGIPSMVDEADHDPRGQTRRHDPISQRGLSAGAALPAFLDVYLDVVSGPHRGGPHKLAMVRTLIGRGAEADLRLNDKNASRKHACLFYDGTEFRIRDVQSANGTFLNGSRVVEYAIRDGDKLLVGDTLLRFRVGEEDR